MLSSRTFNPCLSSILVINARGSESPRLVEWLLAVDASSWFDGTGGVETVEISSIVRFA